MLWACSRTSTWTSTMNTSDPGTVSTPVTESSVDKAPTGVIDPEVITRLANEFFSALPSQPGTPSVAPPVQPPTSASGADLSHTPVSPSVPLAADVSPSPATSFPAGATPGAPLYFLEREGTASHVTTPAYPSAAELFS